MGLTFDQLLDEPTKEELRDMLMLSLQGIGFVFKAGYGPGSLSVSGSAIAPMSVRVKIVAAGSLGTATFKVSTDGGATYGSTLTMAGTGTYNLPSSGAALQFSNGPVGSGDAFQAGDLYSFELTTPTFAATSWTPGSTPRTIIETDAALMEDYARTQKTIAAGGYLSTARADWLDLVLHEQYALDRIPGQATEGTVRLTDSAGAGPFNVSVGQLWVGTTGGLRFNNTTGGTLPLGGTLDVQVKAEKPGTVYNVSNGGIVVMFTTLPGVTVNTYPGSGSPTTWIATQGRNKETDAEAIARAKLRWPSLSTGATADVYTLWAKQTPTYGSSVNRTKVQASSIVAGQVDVYLAGPGGAVSGPVVTAVNDYIQPRLSLTNTGNVQSAVNHTITITGTVNHFPGYGAVAAAQVAQNLTAYISGGTDTTGTEHPGVPIGGVVYRTALIEMIMAAAGVRNVAMTLPAAVDEAIALAATEVAIFDTTGLAFTEVLG